MEYANKRATLPSGCLDSYNCHPIAFKLVPGDAGTERVPGRDVERRGVLPPGGPAGY